MTSLVIILFVAILAYIISVYALKRIWKRLIKHNEGRELVTFLSALLLIPVYFYLIGYIWLICISYYPHKDFEAKKWNDDIEGRYEMTDNIISDSLLVGKTKEDVRILLGTKGLEIEGDKWKYYIGFVPGLANIDPSVLCIEFENDHVVRVYQYET
jgi:amino acid transporter